MHDLQRLIRSRRHQHLMSARFENGARQLPQLRVILHNENRRPSPRRGHFLSAIIAGNTRDLADRSSRDAGEIDLEAGSLAHFAVYPDRSTVLLRDSE